uniref:hypothetical protein n=1 Tax=Algoriphagus sp. TaxID=1872435 RepID=UPI0040482405
MKKIIWIDVGTHFGQEHSSIFGSNGDFYKHIIRRMLGKKLLNRGRFLSFQGLRDIIYSRSRIRKRHGEFHSIFVEANPKIAYTKNIYLKADMVFNLALTDGSQPPVSITKLYLGDGSELSQGSSVFLEKENVHKDSYVATLGVFAGDFFRELELHLNEKFGDYDVLLRLNCEGVEDDVIYSAYSSFGRKLKLICGSLKDVEGVKGLDASQKLDKFINDNKLLFVYFYSGIDSWPKAHAAVLNLLEK